MIYSESPRTSTTTTTTSKSSREISAEDEVDRRKHHTTTQSSEQSTEQGALDRLKSTFSDLQTKISEFETPTITPETFGLPPHFLEWVDKIRGEVSFAPGSISDQIWQESKDALRNPEIEIDARVWIGNEICDEELAFFEKRRKFTRKGLARYLAVKESEIDERDIPTIALAGSGGGYRAMIGLMGYMKAMKEGELFDCFTYMAGSSFNGVNLGVSGSCWGIATYLTYGERSISKTLNHLKARLGTSFTDPTAALTLFTERPTNKYLLRGLVERFKQGYTELGMVDIYGTLVSSRILVPSNELAVHDDLLKLSTQRKFIEDGCQPFPIYTAVRHEIPIKPETETHNLKDKLKDLKDHKNAEGLDDLGSTGSTDLIKTHISSERKQHLEQRAKEESWFQWFELTPYPLPPKQIYVDTTSAAKN
jgi:cytosolic phospholipase A2